MADRSVVVRLRADISDFQRKMATAGTTTSVFVKSLDTADSRMGNLVQTALALGPALVPISATGVPALVGLTSQLGFAAAGAGVLVSAVHGVGGALEAVNKYQLEPTAENYAKMREEMAKLPEEGRHFVRFLDEEVMPALDRLQDQAASGALPGFEEGIDDLMERLPALRRIVDGLADASGQLAEEAGEGLASDEFNDFFRFLREEAEPTLLTFGRTVGNIFDGLATTLIGLNPLANDFEDALLDWSRGFADIEPEDFADFVAYVRDVGPDAVDALAAVGGALVALVQAAAPVGKVALPAIEALANVIKVVASSPAGPALIGAAAGLSAISRAVALFNVANGSAVLGLMRGAKADGDKGARGLTNFGKAAAGLVAVGVAFTVLDELNKRLDETLPGLETLQSRLIDIANTPAGFSISLGAEFDSLAASIHRVTEPELTDGVQGLFDAIAPGDNRAKGLREASKEIEALDTALTDMVASGNAQVAEDALARLIEGYDLSASEVEKLMSVLPGYNEALAGEANSAALAADATDDLGGSMDDAAAKTRTFSETLERLNNLLDGRADMRDYEAAIDDFTAAMRKNGNTFDITTDKGRENQAMLDGIVSSTLAVAEGMKGANRQRFLTSAIADLREMADRFNIPRSQLRELIRELQEANRQTVNPKITADISPAMARINELEARLRNIADEDVFINVRHREYGRNSLGPVDRGADGTTVPKTGMPYADRHLYLLADGEEVISNRHGQADRHRPLLKAINGGLADGGTAGDTAKERAEKAKERAEAARARAEERARREEEKRQRQLDRQRAKDLLASDLRDEEEQARLEVLDAARRLKSARKADRPKDEIREARLALKGERADVRDMRDAAREERAQKQAEERERAEEERREHEAKVTEALISGQERAANLLIDAAESQMSAAESVKESWAQAMERAGAAATSGFRSSLFGDQRHGLWSGSGGGGSSWRDVLMGDIGGLGQRSSLITLLAGQGVTGKALEELLGQASNDQINELLDAGEADDFAALFNEREAQLAAVGQQAGQAAYGAEYAMASAQVAALGNQILILQQQLAAITAQRPITVYESISAQATAIEVARLQALAGAA